MKQQKRTRMVETAPSVFFKQVDSVFDNCLWKEQPKVNVSKNGLFRCK